MRTTVNFFVPVQGRSFTYVQDDKPTARCSRRQINQINSAFVSTLSTARCIRTQIEQSNSAVKSTLSTARCSRRQINKINSAFMSRQLDRLIVFLFDFEVGFWVGAYWAEFWSFSANVNVTAVAADPEFRFAAFENFVVFDVS